MNLSLNSLIAQAMKPQTIEQAQAGMPAAGKESNSSVVVLDSANSGQGNTFDAVSDFNEKYLKSQVASVIHTWASTSSDDLDSGESMADRLLAMLFGIVDDEKDGSVTDGDADSFELVQDYALSYLVGLGADAEDASSLLYDVNDDVADGISTLVSGSNDGSSFVFDSVGNFKKVKVVRNGKVVTVNKRISGVVKLSAKQKMALAKARSKAHTGIAQAHFAKSMSVRAKNGMS